MRNLLGVMVLLAISGCTMVGPVPVIDRPMPPAKSINVRTVSSTIKPVVYMEIPAPPTRAVKKPAVPAYKTVLVRVSAYDPCKRCTPGKGITSTGGSAWLDGAAADPKWLPYGTKITVPGYGTTTVDDTGAAMKKRRWKDGIPRLDVRMTYHWQARQWGVQYLEVKILP